MLSRYFSAFRRHFWYIGFLAVALGAPVGAQTPVDSITDALVEVRLGRLVSRTLPALRIGNDALLPLTDLFELAEIQVINVEGGWFEAKLQPGNVRFALRAMSDTLRLGKKSVLLPTRQMIYRGREFYLNVGLLAKLLDFSVDVNWRDLSVSILDPSALPVGRRLAREASRRALVSRRAVGPEISVGLDRPYLDGLVLDYSVLAPSRDIWKQTTFSGGLGADVLGGSLEVGVASANRGRGGATRTDASWTGVWRENPWLTQLRLGDAIATGPRARSLRGFSISNAPYTRPTFLGNVPFAGLIGPGWQIEAYRGGRLINLDSADALGRFSVDVPVQYGENPVDFVAYGPFGEVRQFNQTYHVISDLLPKNHFEYALSAGECRTTLCSHTTNLDLRYGLGSRWTVAAGLDHFRRDTLANLFHPYATISGGIGNAWALQLEGVGNAVVRGAVRFEPTVDLRVSAEYDQYAQGIIAPILTPAGRTSQLTLQAFARPGSGSSLYFDASIDQARSATGSQTSARIGVSVQRDEIQLLPSVRFEHDVIAPGATLSHTFLTLNTFVLPRPRLGPFLGSLAARTLFESEGNLRPNAVAVYVSRSVTGGLRLETGVAWRRGSSPALSLVMTSAFPSVRSYTTVTAGEGGTSASQFVQGSVLYQHQGNAVSFSAGPSVQRAGVAGRVFLDENGNGRYDPGEELIAGVRIRAGMVNAISDSRGAYRIWDLLPFDPITVVVDSTTLPSPLWVPELAGVRIEPGPNRYRPLDIPIAPGGTLEGRVIRGGEVAGPKGLGGISLTLRNLSTGWEQNLVTFTDGDFYLMGLKPGEYEIHLDEKYLADTECSAEPVRFTMAASKEGAVVKGLELRVNIGPPPRSTP